MSENLAEQFAVLPENLSNHLMITVIALAMGAAISLPLAVYVVKHPRWRYPALTVVSVIQTIPSLALLALMVPLLIGLTALTSRWLGIEFSALGFYPAVIGLTMYSILPMLRNTVTGIMGVDPAMTEAARGMGMTPRQVLWKVELPLAAPVIIAGLRTATVWTVGIATLATPVGQRCLGNYIFRGLQTFNWTAVIFGCIVAAALAIMLDLLLGGMERGVKERRRTLVTMSATVLSVIFVAGLFAPAGVDWARGFGEQAGFVADADREGDRAPTRLDVVRIGSKTFTEQFILARLMRETLQDAGYEVRERESLGSIVIFDALAGGEIDVYVDYTGTIWANAMQRDEILPDWNVHAQMAGWLAEVYGIRTLGSLGFENAYALAMRREHAEELGVEKISELIEHARELRIGGDQEFFGRPEWRSVRDRYGLRFRDQVSYESTFMYQSVASGEVDVIAAFSTDGRIRAFDLKLLEDDLEAIPPYDAVVLLSARAAEDRELAGALAPLIDAVPAEWMREANHKVDRSEDRRTVSAAARWLRERIDSDRDR